MSAALWFRVSLSIWFAWSLGAFSFGTTLNQIAKDHAVYVQADHGSILTITTDHRMGTDPDLIYIFGPDGSLQERREISGSTTVQIGLTSGTGTYKILPVNQIYIHDYTLGGASTPMVVAPMSHQELIRVTGSADLYFQVSPGTPQLTVFAHSMDASATVQIRVYDPLGALVHNFALAPDTFQSNVTVSQPTAGIWRCQFVTSSYDRCGIWLDGVPNYLSSTPATWFEPDLTSPTSATLTGDARVVVTRGARIGVNWWLNPYVEPSYSAGRDVVIDALMDTARITVDWAWREPNNDNGDPFSINWSGFSFTGHDDRLAAYHDDIIATIPDAMPVLVFYWSPDVTWQPENPALWTQTQRDEYAEFVVATMIHTVAPDLQVPPSPTPAYEFEWVELINEPNLTMGSQNYQAYIDIVESVGQQIRNHGDPRIHSLKIVAPGIGWVWGEGQTEMENWIGRLIDQADTYVDGVNWHPYEYLRIEEGHRFGEDIVTVKDWLATRGDMIADESILMTETNQHGGPPTCFQRQDTFYACRWWSAACLASLRAGIDFFQYYKLIDDPPGSYNYKGMMFHEGPYDPPVFPGGPPLQAKPVADAVALVNEFRYDQVVQSACDHTDIAHAITLAPDNQKLSILVANLFDRNIDLNVEIALPPELQSTDFCSNTHRLNQSGRASGDLSKHTMSVRSETLEATLELDPQSIYAFEFFGTDLAVDVNDPFSVCPGQGFVLSAEADGGEGSYTYAWSPESALSDPTLPNPQGQIQDTTLFTVTVEDALGCTVEDSVLITVMTPSFLDIAVLWRDPSLYDATFDYDSDGAINLIDLVQFQIFCE